jgi:hypothetical protein
MRMGMGMAVAMQVGMIVPMFRGLASLDTSFSLTTAADVAHRRLLLAFGARGRVVV